MRTEVKLTLNHSASHFQESTRMFDHGTTLCASGVHNYVKLPKDTRQITLRFFKRHVAESFEIGRRAVKTRRFDALLFNEIRAYCMIDHPKTQLLQSFRSELYRYYINGYKFFRIEY